VAQKLLRSSCALGSTSRNRQGNILGFALARRTLFQKLLSAPAANAAPPRDGALGRRTRTHVPGAGVHLPDAQNVRVPGLPGIHGSPCRDQVQNHSIRGHIHRADNGNSPDTAIHMVAGEVGDNTAPPHIPAPERPGLSQSSRPTDPSWSPFSAGVRPWGNTPAFLTSPIFRKYSLHLPEAFPWKPGMVINWRTSRPVQLERTWVRGGE